MRRAQVVLVAALAISMAGCVLSGKPKTPPAAPTPPVPAPAPHQEPLSTPQTTVELPPFQEVKQEALVTASPPVEAAMPATPKPPAAVPPKPQTRSSTPATVETPEPPPPEPSRPPIREILPAAERKRLLDDTNRWRTETLTMLRRLSSRDGRRVEDINQFLHQSEQAEKSGDIRSASQLAERAYLLAKELQSGK